MAFRPTAMPVFSPRASPRHALALSKLNVPPLSSPLLSRRSQSTSPSTLSRSSSPWRPGSGLDEWVQREARPISLRQLTVFGRTLTESRILSSANYVRTELPTRLAHRLRDMQTLPFIVITNPHMSQVYDLYYRAFDVFRRFPEVKTIQENDEFCTAVRGTLKEHLSVIPKLVMGLMESQDMLNAGEVDTLLHNFLKSRISRRVIAEQHLALTETFHRSPHLPQTNGDFIGQVFLRCNAKEVVERCAATIQDLSSAAYGPATHLPAVTIRGHLDATLTYIPSHLEYIVGELLRNSVQAVVEHPRRPSSPPPPIEVLICESPQHVILRFSDQGGGVPRAILPSLWSFVKGPRREATLANLAKVPQLSATLQELSADAVPGGSLSSLAVRPPNLRLGIGLPMSRVYAEYWAGELELHSLEGYGVDAFLQIQKLGNKNEEISTRARMDSV